MKTKQTAVQPVPEETKAPAEEETSGQAKTALPVWMIFVAAGGLLAAAAVGLIIWFRIQQAKKEAQARQERIRERRRRLQESGVSMKEFDQLLKERQEKKKKEKG